MSVELSIKRTKSGVININAHAGGIPMSYKTLAVAYNAPAKRVQYKSGEIWLQDETDAPAVILEQFCPTEP